MFERFEIERAGEGEHTCMEMCGRIPAAHASQWSVAARAALHEVAHAPEHIERMQCERPRVIHRDLADITELESARQRYLSRRAPDEPDLSLVAIVVKAAVATLRTFPSFNAVLHCSSRELVLKGYYHIGFTVDTSAGIRVPVVHNADLKTTRALAGEVDALRALARCQELAPEDEHGSTFTVVDLGNGLGNGGQGFPLPTSLVTASAAVASLILSPARRHLVEWEGAPERRLFLPISLAYIPCAIDAADAARFTRTMSERLSDPLRLLLEC